MAVVCSVKEECMMSDLDLGIFFLTVLLVYIHMYCMFKSFTHYSVCSCFDVALFFLLHSVDVDEFNTN